MAELLFEVTYPHSPERVWRALTDPKALAAWLMPNDFAPVVGHRFTFRAPQAPTPPGYQGENGNGDQPRQDYQPRQDMPQR